MCLWICARDLFQIRLCAEAQVRTTPLRGLLEFPFTQLRPGKDTSSQQKAAYGVSRMRCFPGCRVRPKQTEIKHCLFLLHQLETHSKVSRVHDNQSVCSLLPFKKHTEKHLAPLPVRLNHFSTIWDHLVAVWGPQEPRALKNVQEAYLGSS